MNPRTINSRTHCCSCSGPLIVAIVRWQGKGKTRSGMAQTEAIIRNGGSAGSAIGYSRPQRRLQGAGRRLSLLNRLQVVRGCKINPMACCRVPDALVIPVTVQIARP